MRGTPPPQWLLAFVAVIALAMVSGCATTEEKYFAGTRSGASVFVSEYAPDIDEVAVMPFKGPTELIGTSVSDIFVTEMLRAGRYTLVERGRMSQVLGESELALAGLSDAQAVEVGAMLGADAVIVGTVSEYATVAQRGRAYPVVAVSARLIQCDNGKVVWSVDHAAKGKSSQVTLAEHARLIVHEMCAGLYQRWRTQRKPRG